MKLKIIWAGIRKMWLIRTRTIINGKTKWVTRQEFEDCEFFNQTFYPLDKNKVNKKSVDIQHGW